MSLEAKLHFKDKVDRAKFIEAMYSYSAMVKYGIKCLKPNNKKKKEVYKIITEKFSQLPARTVSLAVKGDIAATINSLVGIKAENFPISLRFDKYNSEFFVEDDMVKVKMAIHRPEHRKLTWVTADLMPQKTLKYKYYRYLFQSKKGYKVPFKVLMRKGQIYAKITVDRRDLIADPTKPTVKVGIDLRAFWIGKRRGNPLATAFLDEDNNFVRQPRIFQQWGDIPALIRTNQRQGKKNIKKVVTNQIGVIIKQLVELTEDYNPIFYLEDLTGLNALKGPYSKFAYRRFYEVLATKTTNIVKVNPAYTTQTCSRCGKLGKTRRKLFYCNKCYPKGFNKYVNAAINIAKGSVAV